MPSLTRNRHPSNWQVGPGQTTRTVSADQPQKHFYDSVVLSHSRTPNPAARPLLKQAVSK